MAAFGANARIETGIIRMFIPAFVLMCLTCPLKGFFIGVGTFAPGCISEVIGRVITMAVCIPAANLGGAYGQKVSLLLVNPEFVNAYKAFAVPLAFAAGYLAELVFLLITYFTGGKNTRIADTDRSCRYHDAI